MKKLLAILLSILSLTTIKAQNDSFSSVQEVRGKRVYVMNGNLTPCTYILIDGKLKLTQKDRKHTYTITGRSYKVDSQLYLYKKENYLVLKGGQDIFFLKETDTPLYLSLLKNESLWNDYMNDLNNSYTFLDIEKGSQYHKGSTTVCYDKLSRLKWIGFSIGEHDVTLKAEEITEAGFCGNVFSVTNTQYKTLKDIAFIHKDSINPYVTKYEERLAKEKRDKEIQDSVYNCKLRFATATRGMTFGEEDDVSVVNEGDTIAIYVYNDTINKFIGRFYGENIILDESDIRFVDTPTLGTSADKNYLKSKKSEGVEERYEVACEYDDERTQRFVEELRGRLQALNDRVAYMKNHQIFITKAGYNYDDDQFGMDYDIYNCFNKTIKYVEITLTCYNNVGDVQRDYFGYSTKKVRGIGPIEPGEGGSYCWEKIFWDEYDVIKNCRITAIRFIFKDGTSKTFSGYANIRKHFTGDAWDQDE